MSREKLNHPCGIQLRGVQLRQFERSVPGGGGMASRVHATGGDGNFGLRRRGDEDKALVGAQQTSWQMPQPVHIGDHHRDVLMTFIAPGTGQRSEHTVQNEV